MIENSAWMSINNLVLLIHGTKDEKKMRKYALEGLKSLIPYDRAVFYLYDEEDDELRMKRPVVINLPQESVDAYVKTLNNSVIGRRVMSRRRTLAYRSSDLPVPKQEVSDDMQRAELEFLLPNDISSYAGIVFADEEGAIIGEIVLYRTNEKGDFTGDEVEVLDVLKDHLRLRLEKEIQMEKQMPQEEPAAESFDMGLTARELEIARMVEQNLTTEEISERLFISQNTTKKHLSNIFRKMGVSNRMQLAAKLRK